MEISRSSWFKRYVKRFYVSAMFWVYEQWYRQRVLCTNSLPGRNRRKPCTGNWMSGNFIHRYDFIEYLFLNKATWIRMDWHCRVLVKHYYWMCAYYLLYNLDCFCMLFSLKKREHGPVIHSNSGRQLYEKIVHWLLSMFTQVFCMKRDIFSLRNCFVHYLTRSKTCMHISFYVLISFILLSSKLNLSRRCKIWSRIGLQSTVWPLTVYER